MRDKITNELILSEIEKLLKENKLLSQELSAAKESITAIKTGGIDALVIADKKGLKVYTENTADKIYRFLIEKMHEAAVTLDEEGTIIYCNSYFAGRMNLPLQKVIGTKFSFFFTDRSKKWFEDLFIPGGADAVSEEVYLRSGDGKVIPMMMSANYFSMDDHFVLSVILTDLSNQFKNQEELNLKTKQLQQKNNELEIANKDLTSFTYISSHDLQEPLRKIQNFVSCILLEDEKKLSEMGKGYFSRISKTAKRMQSLIEDLLLYSRTKNHNENFEKTNLQSIIGDVQNDFEDMISGMKATMQVVTHCDVKVIKFQFRQLFYNLVSNSLKYAKPGIAPVIKIKCKVIKMNLVVDGLLPSKTDYWHIIYTDNGIGFDQQYSLRIFEVFQRLHSQDEYSGTGIGLAICKRIIENHKGLLTASGKINEGARFDIYIPVI